MNALLLFQVARLLIRTSHHLKPREGGLALELSAALAALLFAVHPLRVESVVWIAERRDLLSLFFLLLSLLAWMKVRGAGRNRKLSRAYSVASMILLILSLLSKTWGMSFAIILILLDRFPLRRLPVDPRRWFDRKHHSLWLEKIPFLAVGILSSILAAWAQRSSLGTMKSLAEWGVVERLAQAFYGVLFYLRKTIWPDHLVACYELPWELNPLDAVWLLSAAVVIGLALLTALLYRRLPALAVSLLIYLVVLAPVLGFAQSGPQLVADKYSYVACIPLAILAAGALFGLARKNRKDSTSAPTAMLGAATAATIVVIALFVGTWRQTGIWQNSKRLWAHAIATGSPSSMAHLNYGIWLHGEGEVDRAADHWRRSVAIRPDAGNAWYLLANQLKKREEYAEAEEAYRNAIPHIQRKQNAYVNLGNLYGMTGRLEEAIVVYRAAVDHVETYRRRMFSPRPYLALGVTLKAVGEVEEARFWLEKAAAFPETAGRAREELAALSGGR